jgi:chromosomal replication initiator protein
MHAIGNQVVAKFPRKRVVYATSEKFTNEFITSIQQGKIDDFRARYRRIDLLLIDDIQFIADKERTQEEFFHTFNAIHEDGKQIVLTSDRPPKAIERLEDRLRSRFEWGLIADISPPDLETRIAILRAKAEAQSIPVPPPVIEFLAQRIVSNIRELEGALTRLVAYATLQQVPVTTQLAQEVLQNILYNPRQKTLSPEKIVDIVALLRRPGRQLRGARQAGRAATADAMYLMRERRRRRSRIGRRWGRDHRPCFTVRKDRARDGGERRLRRDVGAVGDLYRLGRRSAAPPVPRKLPESALSLMWIRPGVWIRHPFVDALKCVSRRFICLVGQQRPTLSSPVPTSAAVHQVRDTVWAPRACPAVFARHQHPEVAPSHHYY